MSEPILNNHNPYSKVYGRYLTDWEVCIAENAWAGFLYEQLELRGGAIQYDDIRPAKRGFVKDKRVYVVGVIV